jgi:SAM-dependent methyltransferase
MNAAFARLRAHSARRAWIQARSVSTHVLKNLCLGVPGLPSIRRALLGSPFGPSHQSANGWHSRRIGQLGEILVSYQNAWADWEWLCGKRVLELGSGVDSCIPYCFCLLGASVGHASDVEPEASFSLSDEMARAVIKKASDYIVRERLVPHNLSAGRVVSHGGVTAEGLATHFSSESLDLLVSTSTLEHVRDPASAVEQMARALRPGGRMIHAIAMGNHCCGVGEGDRLGHLYYPNWLWSAMFRNRVGHNRLRWFEWERLFAHAGFKITQLRLTTIESDEIEMARPYLASRFQHMSVVDLAPSYAVVSCLKS